MKIFTVIVTYNGMRWLERCLDSLRSSSVPTIPVVVDNNSSDDSVGFIKENYPEVVVFQQNKNLGFGQANNIGIRYALENGADFVMLLNQDASVEKDALKFMLDVSDGESMLSPIHLNGDGTKLDPQFKNSVLISDNGMLDDFAVNNCKPIYKTREVCAACWLMPASLLRKIGGFNPMFFHYGEDNNYLQRLDYHNIATYVVPKAFMYHDRENLFGNQKAFYKNWVYRQALSIATDINLTWISRREAFFRLFKDCYFAKLSRGHYVFGMFLVARVKLMFQSKRVRFSKNQDKQLKTNWL